MPRKRTSVIGTGAHGRKGKSRSRGPLFRVTGKRISTTKPGRYRHSAKSAARRWFG